MFGNPYAERLALEATYEDTATVSRPKGQRGADGLARTVLSTVYDGIICALSNKTDSSAQTDAQQNIRRDMTLFVSPDKEIQTGDAITVRRFGRIQDTGHFDYRFQVIGIPVRYLTHIEVALKDVTIA